MRRLRERAKELSVFLRGFFKEPLRVGTSFQSSGFLAKKLERALDALDLADSCVVELGAGCGRLTERIVGRLGADTRLLCFELEPLYAHYLRGKFASEPRVTIIEDRAENLPVQLARHGVAEVSSVISAVPVSGRKNGGLLRAIHESLRDGGRLMQMALVRRCYFEEKEFHYLGRHVCLLNMPPEVLHVCEKAPTPPQ